MDTLFKLKKNVFSSVFGPAMRALLAEFDRIKEPFVKSEILQMISISGQT